MSKAEERALEAYPKNIEWVGNQWDGAPFDVNSQSRVAYIQGYNQAEKDMETASNGWLAPQLDKSYEPYGKNKMMELTRFDGYAMLDAFEAGAHYQKKKDEKWLADNHKQIYNNGYEEGYHQAEKDLELTVDDIMKIDALLIEMWNQSGNKYQEVLKRFKDFKESEEK